MWAQNVWVFEWWVISEFASIEIHKFNGDDAFNRD